MNNISPRLFPPVKHQINDLVAFEDGKFGCVIGFRLEVLQNQIESRILDYIVLEWADHEGFLPERKYLRGDELTPYQVKLS
ncbi:hypothetical protein [Umezakia ovalisporum]|jgi:hypothetical protein|uniref:Uncharacterized protein n=2 Tax=Umezakia ovalisporum TaxID=75695 RepID=A0AA43H2D7_9CYAN|nr:hypothetical protein [Umezakia ovalisporum]MBI1242648.1 hypothetical protein [Nostoc sp. RI_552]MDH6058451.1 hypothetical protein [Umezakia ovalisporum FSS-43]MDH6065451.1 hypothetical protein [Umezakia ovalisporum FSS-62]MDH6067054.1 hypothetical protein [Umezakia ovalisporum APH033B]MDH6071665.1 hypothetical protein [Umezakia ovalisporum CobakiLakeA]